MRRRIALASALFFGVCAPARPAETLRLAVGKSVTIELPENVTTGYSWAMEETASVNSGAVVVDDLGHRRSSDLVGAGGVHSWKLTGASPGKATLVLSYRRPWEKGVARRKSYLVTVSP